MVKLTEGNFNEKYKFKYTFERTRVEQDNGSRYGVLTCDNHYGRPERVFPTDSVLVLFHLLFDSFPHDVERHIVGQSVTDVNGNGQEELDDLGEPVKNKKQKNNIIDIPIYYNRKKKKTLTLRSAACRALCYRWWPRRISGSQAVRLPCTAE